MVRSQEFCVFVLTGAMSTFVLILTWHYLWGSYQYDLSSFMRKKDVPPLRFRYHLQPVERGRFVDSVGASGHVSIRVFVRSVPRERALRDAARDTWVAALMELNFSVIFVVGEPSKNDSGNETATVQEALEREQWECGDILQGNFEDTYQTGSLKLASIVLWQASQELGLRYSVRFLNVFLDRDTVLYPGALLELLRESDIAEKNRTIVGECRDWRGFVVRDPRNKWFVDESVWPSKYYPPYCMGYGYILSDGAMRDIATFLDSLDPSWLAAFQNDDVLFTGVFPLHSRPQYSRSNQPHILSFLANTLLPSRPPPPHIAMEHLHNSVDRNGTSFATPELLRLKWDLYLQTLNNQSNPPKTHY